MRKILGLLLFFAGTVSSFAGVSISSPATGATVTPSVHIVASSTSSTGKPISSIIIYVDNVNKYLVYSSQVDTYLSMSAGSHTILVKSWDSIGAIYQSAVNVSVSNSTSAITLSSPSAGSTVTNGVHFLASAKSQTAYPIASMMLFVDNLPVYTTYSSSLDTTQTLAVGTRNIIIKSWDNSGAIYELPFTVNVTTTTTTVVGTSVLNLDQSPNWQSCDTCAGAGGTGPTAPHSLTQGIVSPSLDGASGQFWVGGSTPYSDVLWWNKILTETQATTNQTVHHFVYDLYFYLDNPTAAQSIEWDVNQFVGGQSYIFGSQCSYRAAGTWDVWDNVNSKWVSTGVPCPVPQAYAWNHVVLEFERTWDNKLHYIAMTLNGTKHYLDWYYPSTATTWSGVTVNYQMDGNYQQQNYSTWVEQMKLTYW